MGEPGTKTERLPLEVVDDQGNRHNVVLKATIIEPKPGLSPQKTRQLPTLKQLAEAAGDPQLGQSNAEEDDLWNKLVEGRAIVIDPPYDLNFLAQATDNNSELGQNIRAMVTNTVKFGYRLREHDELTDENRDEHAEAIADERRALKVKLSAVHPKHSLTAIRSMAKHDKHLIGNGYLELIESPNGELIGLNHVHGHTLRMTTIDTEPTVVEVPVNVDFELKPVRMQTRFRRFVQLRAERLIWFKEAGDPRHLNKYTGEYSADVPFDKRATALIHHRIYSPHTPYGVPDWIGNLFGFFGSRAAEEVNFNTLNNNNVPSMFIIVENGVLTESSIARLKEFIEGLSSQNNYSKCILLEGEPLEEGSLNPTNFKIRIEPVKNLQQTDELFEKYTKGVNDRMRQAFRLPPIFVGRCHSDDTEFLTKRGWKLYGEIADGEPVATKNQATGALEFQVPTARHHYPFEGCLLHLRNRGIDAMVTPNHRMWVRPTVAKNRAEKPWAFVAADYLFRIPGGNGGYLELPVSASWEGEELRTFTIPRNDGKASWGPGGSTNNKGRDEARYASRAEYEVSGDEFVRFLGYFVSEGSTTETPGPITLSQNAGEVATRMMAALRGLGFDPSVTESRPGQLKIDICHVGLWAWLREHCGTASSSKRLPAFALDLCQRQLELLLDSMVDGDGSLPQLGSDGSFTYSTTSRALNDQLHAICLKLSIALTSRRVDRSVDGWSDIWCSYGHYADRHLIDPRRQINEVPYSGMVVCFTVPNGLLVTRRNGRVLISGNSDDYTRATADTSRDIADEQVFAPDRDEDDEQVNRFVLVGGWGALYHTLRSMNPNITDDAELIKLMGIAEKSGGMTPRRADRIVRDVFGQGVGPMPKGIDLDIPFTIQFAQAQQGGQAGATQKTVDQLIDLSKRVDDELTERWADDHSHD